MMNDFEHISPDPWDPEPLFPEPWDPEQHPFDGEVVTFLPFQRLEYIKQPPKSDLGLLTFFLLLFVGVFSLFTEQVGYTMAVGSSLISIFLIYHWKSSIYKQIRWRFDLSQKKLHKFIGDQEELYDLSDASGLLLRLIPKENRWSSNLSMEWNQYNYTSFTAETYLVDAKQKPSLRLASTGEIGEGLDLARAYGLSFISMLSDSLELPFRIEEPMAQNKQKSIQYPE